MKQKEEKIERRTDKLGRCNDLLEIARLVSWCLNRDYLIQTSLDHISQRLGKRARCVLLNGEELKLHYWVGSHKRSTKLSPVCEENIIWKAIENGAPVNFSENGSKIKAIIPLWHVDSLSQEEKRLGALIVNSGKNRDSISDEDFEYLKLSAELIGGAIGKIELIEQVIESYRSKGAMTKETAHLFRNRITAIGTFSQQIARLAHSTDLARKARMLYQEVLELEAHLGRFEKYMDSNL